ncbi:MAG: S8 family serine peptidase, partial [Deltaproteobacteria bacterium]|nr:S8 family serine peptidase [Deltaproteobacteria bacterium]
MTLPFQTRRPAAKHQPLCLALFLLLIIWSLPAQAEDKISRLGEIQETIAQNGQARVVVQFQVGDLTALTNASRAARQDGEARGATGLNQAAVAADEALRSAVTAGADAVLNTLPAGAYQVARRLGSVPFLALWVNQDGLAALEASSAVVGVVPDQVDSLILPEEDGSKGATGDGAKGGWTQVGAGEAATVGIHPPNLSESAALIGANNAWSRHYTGAGWYVAVLDTGIRKTHEMFAGKTIYEACFASGQDGSSGDCPNGGTSMIGAGAAVHYSSIYGSYDHGTHVSGIAAGHSSSLKGVAYGADIMAIKTYSRFYDASNGYRVRFWRSDMLAGLDHVYQISSTYNIASANISGGGGACGTAAACYAEFPGYFATIDNLRAVGIPVFASSGNDGYCDAIGTPACVTSAVAVGATTKADAEASYNNWQIDLLDLFAPGSQIYSSTGGSDTSYESWNGTSMASPHGAGAFALMRQYSPTGNVETMLSNLVGRGVQIYTPCASGGSKPRLRVDKAMVSVSPATAPGRTAMYRAYNPNLSYHFFTTRYAEFLNAVLAGYNDESTPIPFYPLSSQLAGSSGINRLYDPNRGVHYYTAKSAEVATLVALGWNLERVEGYIYLSTHPTGTSLIYKLYNNATGTHLYTSSASERQYILTNLPTWDDNQPLGYAYLSATTAREAADGNAGSDPYVAADAAAAATATGGSAATASRGSAGATSGQGAASGALASGSASGASDLGNTAVAS